MASLREEELSDSEVTLQKMTEGFWKGQQELLIIEVVHPKTSKEVNPDEDINGNVVLIWFHVIHLFCFLLNEGVHAGI